MIKFKSTKSTIDAYSFVLKLSINDEEEKVELSDLRNYIDQLVDNCSIEGILDLSTTSEQILQIQYQTEIGSSLSFACLHMTK